VAFALFLAQFENPLTHYSPVAKAFAKATSPYARRCSLHTLSSHLGAGKVASGGYWGSGNGLMGQRGRRLLLRLQICLSVCVCENVFVTECVCVCECKWLGERASAHLFGVGVKRLKTCYSRKTSKKHTCGHLRSTHTHTCQYSHSLIHTHRNTYMHWQRPSAKCTLGGFKQKWKSLAYIWALTHTHIHT